ncbi:MAG TPA: AMP-binding protein [Acidimicrobiia bacterium]|nr:AMP-binding protein [Acidimicrobiia bacterium]
MVWLSTAMTMGDLLVRAAERDPDHDALVFPDVRYSFADLLDRAVEQARSLVTLGVESGDHVGILMPNHPDVTEVMFGALLAGAVPVPINARFKKRELAYVVGDADLVVLVTTDVVAEHIDYVQLLHASIDGLADAVDPANLSLGAAPELRAVVCLGSDRSYPGMVGRDAFGALAAETDPSEVEERRRRVRVRDTGIMIYTSGTTANPKGCPLSHEALVRTGRATRDRFRLTDEDAFWDPLPMFHMSSILPITACLDAGASFISLTHYTPDAAIDQIIAERPTVVYSTFPTITASLVAHPRWPEIDLERVRLTCNIAPEDLLRRFQAAFPHAIQVAAYGLSEATGVVGYNELTDTLDQRIQTTGRPFPGVQVRIVDPETLEERPPGEVGEIWVRGYSLFEGYWKDPEKQAESVTADGWLRTGDLCTVDADGRISYEGRLKDMLKVGGENVAAIEIESFLANHPSVKLAQVVGIPDEKYLEVPAAFVQLHDHAAATADELVEFCRGKIASFKVPRRVVFVDEWPMSATKIQKFRLRQGLLAGEFG